MDGSLLIQSLYSLSQSLVRIGSSKSDSGTMKRGMATQIRVALAECLGFPTENAAPHILDPASQPKMTKTKSSR